MINARKEIKALGEKVFKEADNPDAKIRAIAMFHDLEQVIYYCRRNKLYLLEEYIKEHKEEYLIIIQELYPKI
jgi:hypothetical protein